MPMKYKYNKYFSVHMYDQLKEYENLKLFKPKLMSLILFKNDLNDLVTHSV
jgi:hypothetical protein